MRKNKIFVACDTKNIKKIREIINKTQSSNLNVGYKFGLEFLNSKNGRTFVSKIKNKTIFADLKLHDIPNTCASTIKAIKDLKVNYLTMHISSGLDALKAAKKVSGKIKLIGVTILTSLDNKALKEIGFNKDVKKIVHHQARLANKAKLDAIEKFIDQQIPQLKLKNFKYFHEPIIRDKIADKPKRAKRNSATSRFGRRR